MAFGSIEEVDLGAPSEPVTPRTLHSVGHASGMRPIALPTLTLPKLPRAAKIGDVIERRWHIDDVLGQGGMATVYAATHRNGSRVALKMLRPELAYEAALVVRFFAEGRLANLVDHPGVVRSLDDGTTEDGVPYLVMELLDGQSLEERLLERGPVTFDQAVFVATKILSVLAAAHAQGIVHRDVKPENVILTRRGRVKLLDFGIARSPAHFHADPVSTRTASGVIMGTPAFMAPEQARGRWEEVDARTDLFATAATIFRALTGGFLRSTETVMEELGAAMLPLPPVRTLAPQLPPRMAEWLDRALMFDRADRFRDAAEMLDALEHVRTEPLPLRRLRSSPSMSSLPSLQALENRDVTASAPEPSGSFVHLSLSPFGHLRTDATPGRVRRSWLAYVTAAIAMLLAMAFFVALTLSRPSRSARPSAVTAPVASASAVQLSETDVRPPPRVDRADAPVPSVDDLPQVPPPATTGARATASRSTEPAPARVDRRPADPLDGRL